MRVCIAAGKNRKARLLVNPRYRPLLERVGLARVEDFLALPAVIVCGHRHRHVAQLTLGEGAWAVGAYLKREQRVPWKVYLSSAWAGFGWVTRSYREALLLHDLQQAGVPCPDWIAAGEDGTGQAFLLVRALPGARELREFLHDEKSTADVRRTLTRQLGEELARLHAAGFHHADLHSKHVLVSPDGQTIHLLDWQRSRRHVRLSWRRRLSDLAALDATLDDTLVSPRERLRCLRAYLRATSAAARGTSDARRQSFSGAVARICGQALRLLRKRYIREVRHTCLPMGQQNLIWLDGEALCVTREFQATLHGQAPSWLQSTAGVDRTNGMTREEVPVPGARRAILVRRWVRRPLRWLWQRLRGHPFTSPEFQQAAVLFRLQRFGITTPRLLAVGQRHSRPWQTESFLLTEPLPHQESLPDWLARRSCGNDQRRHYRQVLRDSGLILRRLHEAGCYFGEPPCGAGADPASALGVREREGETPAVVVSSLEGIRTRRRPRRSLAIRDLVHCRRMLTDCTGGRTDVLRFILGYLGRERATPAAKRLLRSLFGQRSDK